MTWGTRRYLKILPIKLSQIRRKTGENNGLLTNEFLINDSCTAIQQEKDVSEKSLNYNQVLTYQHNLKGILLGNVESCEIKRISSVKSGQMAEHASQGEKIMHAFL